MSIKKGTDLCTNGKSLHDLSASRKEPFRLKTARVHMISENQGRNRFINERQEPTWLKKIRKGTHAFINGRSPQNERDPYP